MQINNKLLDQRFVLFDGSTNTNFNLTDNYNNYDEIIVIYGTATNGYMKTTTIYPTISSAASLFLSQDGYLDSSYYGVRQSTTRLSFNNTNVIKLTGYTFSYKSNGTFVFSEKINEIYIKKVIGIKYRKKL